MTRPIDNISDPRYVRALSHPLRVRILAILEERLASPLDLSRILRADLGVVAYHVRTLHRLGLITLERETKVRGATQRHYRARERPRISNEAWAKAPPIFKQALIDATLDPDPRLRARLERRRRVRPLRRAHHPDRAAAGSRRLGPAGRAADAACCARSPRSRTTWSSAWPAGQECELEDVGLVIMLFKALPFSAAPHRGARSDH